MKFARLSECTKDAQFAAAHLAADAFDEGDAEGYLAYFCEKFTGKNSVHVLMAADGSVIGCFSIKYEPCDGFVPCIGDVVVDPAWRNHGVGRRLLDEACDILSQDGWGTAYLWCTDKLREYYEKQGWAKMTDVRDNVFVMCKELNSPQWGCWTDSYAAF